MADPNTQGQCRTISNVLRMTSALCAMALVLFLSLGAPETLQAHSLEYLEREIQKNEQYFQVINKPAPEFSLQDAEGNKFRLVDFRDKVVVLNFVYTRCPDVCPLHTALIAEIQAMVKLAQMQDRVQFVTVTTDPKNDTPEVVQDFGLKHGLDSVNWVFLTSGVDQSTATRELVGRFGHKFTEAEEGYQVHGVVTHVIDREGRWRANFHGLKFNLTNLILFTNALANDSDSHEPTKNQTFWEKLREMF